MLANYTVITANVSGQSPVQKCSLVSNDSRVADCTLVTDRIKVGSGSMVVVGGLMEVVICLIYRHDSNPLYSRKCRRQAPSSSNGLEVYLSKLFLKLAGLQGSSGILIASSICLVDS